MANALTADSIGMIYRRGRLIVVPGEHPPLQEKDVRIRYHTESKVLAIQGPSKWLVDKAESVVLDSGRCPMPERVSIEYPGRYAVKVLRG
jgi:hypothetical protein